MTPDVSVIIMTYNEASAVEGVILELDEALRGTSWRHETIVVDDGSVDGSGEIADARAQQMPHVQVIHHESNRGIGEVYRSGFAAARGRYVSFLPADGQFPAAIIREFLPLMDNHDLVLGYLPNRKRSALAKALSFTERLLYRAMFGKLPDFQGILMFRRGALEALGVRTGGRGWQVLMELIVRAKRARYGMISVPTDLRPRVSGRSKVTNVRAIWANLAQALALRLRLFREQRARTWSALTHRP